MEDLQNIIFDLGNVIIDIDLEAVRRKVAQLTGTTPKEVQALIDQSDIFLHYEKGQITSRVFRDQLRDLFHTEWPDSLVDELWNGILLNIPKERFRLLEHLAPQYRMFVLSNTNEIHIQQFEQIVEASYGWSAFESFFDKIYYSHQMGKRKPEPEIFNQVIKTHQLKPGATLFIDDFHENVVSADALGLQTLHVTSPQILIDHFNGA